MLDPDRLLENINGPEGLKAQRAAHEQELSADRRLPEGYFEELAAAISEERTDPHRVTRATSPSGPAGPPAPPPVIYLSRKPSVSQFMSVINDCFEQELEGSAAQGLLHLGNRDRLKEEIERFAEDTASRFRRFGPCDIRFIEPKLAELLVGFTGRHAFATQPAHAQLDEQAEVILVGDWATGLPQARNVAARIGERLAAADDPARCHVIHLGDIGHLLTEDKLTDIGPVDVVLVPIGGALSATKAAELVAQLDAKVVVPMPVCEDEDSSEALGKFLHEMGVSAAPAAQSKLSLMPSSLPAEVTTVVLEQRGKVQ